MQYILDPATIEQEYDELMSPRVLRKALAARSPGGMLTNNVAPGGSVLPSAIEQYRKRAADLYKQGSDLYGQEPDTSELQNFARQRGQDSQGAMLNALAAQFAGEQFQPVQAQFLKKAAAAQDPIKIGSGMLTSEGQYIKDPFAAQDKKAEFLLQQAKAYEGLAQTAVTAEERADAAKAARESADRYREVMGAIAQQNANTAAAGQSSSADHRRTMEAIAAQNAQTQRMIAQGNAGNKDDKRADSLRTEYLKRADKVREGTGHAQNVMQMLSDPSTAKDPTKQVALIFSFGKMLDPDSVVRESEYALIANARGLADRLQQIVPQIQTGARLTPQQLQSMQQVATNLLQGSTTRIQDLDQYYADLAKRRKLSVEDVLPSFNQNRQSPAPAPGASPAPLSAAEQAELARLRSRFGGNRP